MPRPSKVLSDADWSLLLTLREAGLGYRLISRALSDERGAFNAEGRRHRDRKVGKDLIGILLNRLETEASGNPNMVPNAMHRLETASEVDGRLTKPQTKPKGESNDL